MLGDNGQPPYTYSQLLTDAGAGKIDAITMDGDRLSVTFAGRLGANTDRGCPARLAGHRDLQADLQRRRP